MIPLPPSSARHLLLCEPRRAWFAYFDKPGPEAVCKHFAKLGLNVRRWDVDVKLRLIEVSYESEGT